MTGQKKRQGQAAVRRPRRRRQRNRQGGAIAPRSQGISSRGRISGDMGTVVVQNQEFWGNIGSSAPVAKSFNIWPGETGLPNLDNMAALFDQYRIKRWRVLYKTSSGTTTSGVVNMGVLYDSLTIADFSTQAAIVALQPQRRFSPWDNNPNNCSLQCDAGRLMKGRWHYTPSQFEGVARVHPDLGSAGYIVTWCSANQVVGELWVDYELEFFGPRRANVVGPSIDPFYTTWMEYAAVLTTSTGGSVLNLFEHCMGGPGAVDAPNVNFPGVNTGSGEPRVISWGGAGSTYNIVVGYDCPNAVSVGDLLVICASVTAGTATGAIAPAITGSSTYLNAQGLSITMTPGTGHGFVPGITGQSGFTRYAAQSGATYSWVLQAPVASTLASKPAIEFSGSINFPTVGVSFDTTAVEMIRFSFFHVVANGETVPLPAIASRIPLRTSLLALKLEDPTPEDWVDIGRRTRSRVP